MKGKYRHELKYSVSYADYLILRPRLRIILRSDPHTGADGTYQIHSIYFDNYRDKALREKIIGTQKREKWRIRWYNHDLSFLTLEKKMKVGNLCMKFDAQITEEQCRRIMANDTEWMLDSHNDLLQEFYCRQRAQMLYPRVLVSYHREPYIYAQGNVRITFDSDVRTSLYETDFLNPELVSVDASDPMNDRILEVKYDEFLPGVVADLIQAGRLRQESFSKYGACRRFG